MSRAIVDICVLCVYAFVVNQNSYSTAILVRFKSEDDSRAFCAALEHWKKEAVVTSFGGISVHQIY
ncbi:hypothetical protein Sjap_004758 [Stephania japonica]|uniref:Probable histone-arginine methyltransferase CARM1-like N-terminal PH domain-containing protein n=1 Tax=Stephania japonica TaxID=461633 RepID=A0AAP0K562_9MAGN